jgi:group I intron endonuclease
MNETYTVYIHTSPTNKIYVGITCQTNLNRRWQNGQGYRTQRRFYRAIKKYGWENIKHVIVAQGLTKEEAEQKEIELIKKYESTNPQKGYNIENGGNVTGTHSEETKLKISMAQRGEKNHAYGKPSPLRGIKKTPEEIEHNRLAHIGQTPWCKGIKMTDEQKKNMGRYVRTAETIEKMSKSLSRAVKCVETGVVYPSCKQAGIENGVNRGSISNAALGKVKTAGGLHWKYV